MYHVYTHRIPCFHLFRLFVKSICPHVAGSRAEVPYQYSCGIYYSCGPASARVSHTDKVKQGLHAHATRNCEAGHGQRDPHLPSAQVRMHERKCITTHVVRHTHTHRAAAELDSDDTAICGKGKDLDPPRVAAADKNKSQVHVSDHQSSHPRQLRTKTDSCEPFPPLQSRF